jgi:N-acetylneuraminate synthase
MGASIFEKHLVLDEMSGAIDAPVSATPETLRLAVRAAARATAALGDGRRGCLPAEAGNREGSRRALYATRDLRPGDVVTASDVIALRPARGLAASAWEALTGVRLTRTVAAGQPFLDRDLAGVREGRDAA